ncbi:hypothetical protein ACFQ3Z_42550 [Streptomyces nogalater]
MNLIKEAAGGAERGGPASARASRTASRAPRAGPSPSARRPGRSGEAGGLRVGDEGGRPVAAGEATLTSYGSQVPAAPKTGATTGTVSVIAWPPGRRPRHHRHRTAPGRGVRARQRGVRPRRQDRHRTPARPPPPTPHGP